MTVVQINAIWPSLICTCIYFLTFTKGQFDSYEINQIDLLPLQDAIIFNDIADILNDFDSSMNPQLDKYLTSDSDSEENAEDLLFEYQRYLDKAQKQRINYIQKFKGKNKVPLKHHEIYTKMKPSNRNKYDASNDYYNDMKYSQSTFTEPLSLFLSQNEKLNTVKKSGFIKDKQQDYKETKNAKTLLKMYPTISHLQPLSSCYCNANQIPCKCGCKQCIVLTDSLSTMNLNPYDTKNVFFESFPQTPKHIFANKVNKINEDKLNIRVKIDVKLPKILTELIHKYRNKDKSIAGETIQSKETISAISLPFPLNFPFSLDVLGHQKMHNKHDNSAVHKITIHKKEKSHNNKKHMGKKIVTFHSIKDDQPMSPNITKEINKIGRNNSTDIRNKEIEETKTQTNKSLDEIVTNSSNNNTLTNNALNTKNDTIKTIYLKVNITKYDNDTNEAQNLENSIETELVEKKNKSTVEPLRLKREALDNNIKTMPQNNTNTILVTLTTPTLHQSTENYTKVANKFNKTIAGEIELLYWPTETKNVKLVKSKNITALILERETKKSKLNMTHKIRSNRTIALEQAIFGDVDWNDVDTVAPVFISFVGKYIRGVLTLCSQNVCHSMKCSEKICLHRICKPENRFNHKGHCTGNKETDSVAAMESIMDLPSNIAFEIVDILQEKMLGKIYGKATLCIISKCSTFVASKKSFQRSKCISKELSAFGHCPIVKNFKIA